MTHTTTTAKRPRVKQSEGLATDELDLAFLKDLEQEPRSVSYLVDKYDMNRTTVHWRLSKLVSRGLIYQVVLSPKKVLFAIPEELEQ